MSQKAFTDHRIPDLTRWNRSGLGRFRYTSEAGAEFTEALRIGHLLLYARGQLPVEIDPPEVWRDAFASADGIFPDGKTMTEKLGLLGSDFSRSAMDGVAPKAATYAERLLAQYEAILTDPSAQVSRAFARALHVLGESLDAYANESTLRTATQKVHAQHLLSLIGHVPRPAASAVMPVAYLLKADQGRVTLPVGTGLEHALPDDGPPLSFEALSAVEAHPSLNGLRVEGHLSQRDAILHSTNEFTLDSRSPFSAPLVGQIAVLEDDGSRESVRVMETDRDRRRISVRRGLDEPVDGGKQTARFLSSPALTLAPRPRGGAWVHFQTPPETFPQAIVLAEFGNGETEFKRVAEVRGRDIRLSSLGPKMPMDVFEMGFMTRKRRKFDELPEELGLDGGFGPGGRGGLISGGGGGRDPEKIVAIYATQAANVGEPDAVEVNALGYLGAIAFGWQPTLLKQGTSLGTLVDLDPGFVYVDGIKSGDLTGHSFAVFESRDRAEARCYVVSTYDPQGLKIAATGLAVSAEDVTELHFGFSSDAALEADPRARSALIGFDAQITVICRISEQDLLTPGRVLMLEEDEGADADVLTIAEVLGAAGEAVTLRLDAGALNLSAYRKGFTTIRGNVAEFGHGKSLPARVLGSGDNSVVEQEMVIEDTLVATRLNPGFPGGVAADIEISVDGRTWQQLAPASRTDEDIPSYRVLPRPDGFLTVRFDRRLTSGTDNVMLTRIRQGAGARGNDIPRYGATNLKPKHSAVQGVVQPLAPQSGADAETLESLRHDGKSTYALFSRALAVEDFARFAETHGGVVHAHADLIRQRIGGAGNLIRLTVAPQGGEGLDLIREDLETMLVEASQPGTRLLIEPFVKAPLSGTATVTLLSGYANAADLKGELETLLDQAFGLSARPLGRTLYLSEIVAAIESHRAVDYVTVALSGPCGSVSSVKCTLAADGTVQAISPDVRTSVYLAERSDLTLIIEAGTTAGTGA